jgi:hypothetical protein
MPNTFQTLLSALLERVKDSYSKRALGQCYFRRGRRLRGVKTPWTLFVNAEVLIFGVEWPPSLGSERNGPSHASQMSGSDFGPNRAIFHGGMNIAFHLLSFRHNRSSSNALDDRNAKGDRQTMQFSRGKEAGDL